MRHVRVMREVWAEAVVRRKKAKTLDVGRQAMSYSQCLSAI